MTSKNRRRKSVSPPRRIDAKGLRKRKAKAKKEQIRYAKMVSIALILVVFGAIAFFVYRNRWPVESRPSSAPHGSRAPKALALAKEPLEVIVRT